MPTKLPVAVVALAAAFSATARADDQTVQAPPPPPPGYPQPQYPAPLSQTVQPTYVPQSIALSGPTEITDWDPDRPIPAGYTPVLRRRKHLIVAGAVTLGCTYFVSALVAAIGHDADEGGDNTLAPMAIPIVGPFVEMGQTSSATAQVFLVGMGAAEVAGAIMLGYGLWSKQRVLVRNDLVGSLNIGPMMGNGATGMVLSGRF